MSRLVRQALLAGGVVVATVLIASFGTRLTANLAANRECCDLPPGRNLVVALAEMVGLRRYPAEIGQDKWVLERMFPGVADGFFLDVGSAHGTLASNSWALERRGWTGICVDPFPIHMEGRTCRLFRDVVFSESGRRVRFHAAGGVGGIGDTLGHWNEGARGAPVVDFETVTLRDVLLRSDAPRFIHFVSLDIEGAEYEALRAFPFERVSVGAWAIEHNREEPKRSNIRTLLEGHGYRRVRSWQQDDFYAPARPR